MESHPKWKNPPLREAVFEIRFSPVSDYSIFVGEMAAAVKDKFPERIRLPGDDLPQRFDGVVRHRFVSQDKFMLMQIGAGIASLNFISYPGFESVLINLEFLLNELKEFINLENKTRLGLRYINHFEASEDPFRAIKVKPPFEEFDIESTERIRINHIKKNASPLMISINIEFPMAQTSMGTLLDLDAYQSEFKNTENERAIDFLLDWARNAHALVWENFRAIISEEEASRRL